MLVHSLAVGKKQKKGELFVRRVTLEQKPSSLSTATQPPCISIYVSLGLAVCLTLLHQHDTGVCSPVCKLSSHFQTILLMPGSLEVIAGM
eukprot:m.161063 g.161063  ORF g.161063 m.161063 type:complete len:90 (+) comp14358_c1_seq3:1722-1991(+)